jgi:hypothetical protein
VKKMWGCGFGDSGAGWGSFIDLKLGGSSGQPQYSTKPEDQLLFYVIMAKTDSLLMFKKEREPKILRSCDQGLQHD